MVDDFRRICLQFGGNTKDKRPLNIDTTFQMGNYYVTFAVARDPMFIHSKYRNEILAVVGVFIHSNRDETDFRWFAQKLEEFGRLPPRQLRCLAWVTDGDEATAKGFNDVQMFANSPHVLCEKHLRDNVKDKMEELKLPKEYQNVILCEIFGKEIPDGDSRTRIGGLVDMERALYFEIVDDLKREWTERELGLGLEPKFAKYFESSKERKIADCYLAEVSLQKQNYQGFPNKRPPPNKRPRGGGAYLVFYSE